MHELSVVISLIETISEDAQKRGIKKITHFRLSLGEFSSINPRALEFALQALTKQTILHDASYDIVMEEARAECHDCHFVFRPVPPFFLCPSCGKGRVSFLQGRLLNIEYYEGE